MSPTDRSASRPFCFAKPTVGLRYLQKDIQVKWTKTIKTDSENIDDFRSVGLLMEVAGGFSYTKRAFELLKYGLLYEKNIKIPDKYPQRLMAGTVAGLDYEDVSEIT